MRELLITNDPVLLGFAQVLLADQGIEAHIFDQHISLMEGSIGAFPHRLLVPDEQWPRAAGVLRDAGLGAELKGQEK